MHNICKERCSFLLPEEWYYKIGTDVNRELNATETSEGNAIRNSICNFLWNQRNMKKQQ